MPSSSRTHSGCGGQSRQPTCHSVASATAMSGSMTADMFGPLGTDAVALDCPTTEPSGPYTTAEIVTDAVDGEKFSISTCASRTKSDFWVGFIWALKKSVTRSAGENSRSGSNISHVHAFRRNLISFQIEFGNCQQILTWGAEGVKCYYVK